MPLVAEALLPFESALSGRPLIPSQPLPLDPLPVFCGPAFISQRSDGSPAPSSVIGGPGIYSLDLLQKDILSMEQVTQAMQAVLAAAT